LIALALASVTGTQSRVGGPASAQSDPNIPTVRVYTSEVLVPVTVTDKQNRYVTDLQKEDFRVWEDKIEQKIENFFTEDAPMSLGIILDISESMKSTVRDASQSVNGCLKASDLDDEFFLVLFSDKAQPATEFTTDIRKLQNMILFLKARGFTALYDAVYNGLVKVKEGVNPRKALVVASDGGENNSRYRPTQLKQMIQEQDIQIYTIGSRNGVIREMTQITGGRALNNASAGSLENICKAMVQELKNQYVLVYKSTNRAEKGTWRNIRVKVTSHSGVSDLGVRHKTKYFVPDDGGDPNASRIFRPGLDTR